MITNIQRFSIHDGSGIRTTVFFKGCPLHCAWCSNPETQHHEPEMMRKGNGCVHCGACVEACPHGGLMWEDGAIRIVPGNCQQCGKCITVCPQGLLELCGQELSADQILSIVLRDRPFYEASGGGLTLSGGEPLLQPVLALELLRGARNNGISTAIETCLYAPFAAIEQLLPWLDEIYFDCKHMDSEKHLRFTGKGNEQILENISRLLLLRPDAHARIPVIPGFNDSPEDIRCICNGMKQLGIHEAELMRYHRLGDGKYSALGRQCQYHRVPLYSDDAFESIRQMYQAGGICPR